MQTTVGETRESHTQCVIRVDTADHHSQTLLTAAVVDASSQSEAVDEEPKRTFEDRASDAYHVESDTRAADSQTLAVLSAHATTQCEPLAIAMVDRASDAYRTDASSILVQCRIEPDNPPGRRSVDSQTVVLALTADAIVQCESALMMESGMQTVAATSEMHYADSVAQTDPPPKAFEMHCQTSPASGSKYGKTLRLLAKYFIYLI